MLKNNWFVLYFLYLPAGRLSLVQYTFYNSILSSFHKSFSSFLSPPTSSCYMQIKYGLYNKKKKANPHLTAVCKNYPRLLFNLHAWQPGIS
jgi:hypothetical protein